MRLTGVHKQGITITITLWLHQQYHYTGKQVKNCYSNVFIYLLKVYDAAVAGRDFYQQMSSAAVAPVGYGGSAHHSLFRYMTSQSQIKQEQTCLWVDKVTSRRLSQTSLCTSLTRPPEHKSLSIMACIILVSQACNPVYGYSESLGSASNNLLPKNTLIGVCTQSQCNSYHVCNMENSVWNRKINLSGQRYEEFCYNGLKFRVRLVI